MALVALTHTQPSFALPVRRKYNQLVHEDDNTKWKGSFCGQLGRSAIVAAVARAARSKASSEALWIELLEKCTESLGQLSKDWKDLRVDASKADIQQLQSKESAILELLKRCPWGDPSATAFVRKYQTLDAITETHGQVTRAVVECELSRLSWELRKENSMESQDPRAARFVSLLRKVSVHRLRLFDIESAHASLTEAWQMCSAMPDLLDIFDIKLFEHTSKLLAARAFNFNSADESPKLREVLLRLQALNYTEANVLGATGVSTLSSLSIGATNQQVEEHLSLWCSQANDPSDLAWRFMLVDLVLLFLLHKTVPLHKVCEALGQNVYDVLLDHHILRRMAYAEKRGKEPTVFASVALWPVRNLIVATDFETTCFSDATEPAMYLSQDSLALLAAAPQRPVHRVLDLCCGCGIQGLAALNSYAAFAVFVDINPRCLSLTSFNLSLNGLRSKCECLLEKDVREMQGGVSSLLGRFDVILANPPFMPNPQNIATGASILFGNGGNYGEDILSKVIRFACEHLESEAQFLFVSKTPNIEAFPSRLRSWLSEGFRGSAHIFHGVPIRAEEYMPTAISSRVEPIRYQAALEEQGIHTLSQVLVFMESHRDSSDTFTIHKSQQVIQNFWLNREILQRLQRRFEKSQP
ncbi:unnamed protein product [Durusdinium trenchii]|uniref:MTS domain-containing protein n=2 Tax=Durusdinium trenchii TaxID=1381693 RepID=A0ABP0ISZ0_9DINO